MSNFPIRKKDDIVYGEIVDEKFQIYDNLNRQSSIQSDFQYNIRQYDKNVVYLENVNNMLLSPLVQRAIESVTTKYNVIDILGEKRNNVYTEIESVVKEKLSESGIDFFSLVLLDTEAGAAIESAIEQEAVAKKAVETASE